MATKHWQIAVKGTPGTDEIERCVGAGGGLVTRVHTERGRTDVYMAGSATAARKAVKELKGAQKEKQVSSARVKKIR